MNLKERQQVSIDYYIQVKKAEYEKVENIHILRFEVESRGVKKPALALFVGNSVKPSANYYYGTVEGREKTVQMYIDREKERLAEKQKKLESRKAFVPTTKPGDIFVSSWGYEQTNVDFYLCTEMKGKTGTFVEIGSKSVEGSRGHDCDTVLPDTSIICGEPFKKLVSQSGQSEYISMESYKYVHKWNGGAQHRSWGY